MRVKDILVVLYALYVVLSAIGVSEITLVSALVALVVAKELKSTLAPVMIGALISVALVVSTIVPPNHQ